MDLATAARELYGLRPDGFTAARNEYAARTRTEGDRKLADEVKRLRRPTTAGWVLNLLAREDREELEAVVELGGRLRDAVGVLAADQLRALDRQRRELTRAVAARGAALAEAAGHGVAAPVVAEVEESLRAAMVDERAARALLTGVLVDAFSSTGLEPVDLERVLAVPGLVPEAGTRPAPARRQSRTPAGRSEEPAADDDAPRREAARRRLEDASRAALESAEAAGEAEAAVRTAVRARREADRTVEELRSRLEEAEESARQAHAEEDAARTARDAAEGRRRRAAEAESRARAAAAEWLPGASPG
ncbi:MAG TPA: hypothetical protein VF140_05505 [Phycicoccus sp.]